MAIFTFATLTFAYSVGDVNNDGNTNASDALVILKHSAKIDTLSNDVAMYADIDWDGAVNATDALYILKAAAKIQALPDGNPYFYNLEENNGMMMNKLPYSYNKIVVNSVSVDEDGYMSISITNNTGKAIRDAYINYKCYNKDNEMITNSSVSIRELDNGETGISSTYLADNAYKIVFNDANYKDGVSVSGIATAITNGIVTNKLPYEVKGLTVNSFTIDKYGYVTLNVTNNTGYAIKYSNLYYKCYNENGVVTTSTIASLKDINNGENCTVNLYIDKDTTKVLIYDAYADVDETSVSISTETYAGIEVNKLPYTDKNKLRINSIEFGNYDLVTINVTNNSGIPINGMSYISYKCINSSGTVVKTSNVYIYNMNSGENADISFYKTSDTVKILFNDSSIREGLNITDYETTNYDNIVVNTLPAYFEKLRIDSISISGTVASITVTNNTDKAVSYNSYLYYRCVDSSGTIIKDSTVSVYDMNSAEKCKKSFTIPEDTVKLIFYGSKIYEGTASENVVTSKYSGITMNKLPYTSADIELKSVYIERDKVVVTTENKTGSAITGSSYFNYKCYNGDGVIVKSGYVYLNDMNDGDTFDAYMYKTSDTTSIIFYDFKVKK